MTITAKDRIFMAAALPAAIVALYVWLLGSPERKKLEYANDQLSAYGDEEMLEMREAQLKRKLSDAEKRLADAVKAAEEAPESALGASANESSAARIASFRQAIRDSGARVVSCAIVSDSRKSPMADAQGASPWAMLSRAGVRNPSTCDVKIEATYASMTIILGSLSEKKMPVIVESVSMEESAAAESPRRWSLRVHL